MKFKFKIQQYQTDAVERTVEVFTGQPSVDNLPYRRDLGKRDAQTSIYDNDIETGYRNNEVQLIPSELLANIRKAQAFTGQQRTFCCKNECLFCHFQFLVAFIPKL